MERRAFPGGLFLALEGPEGGGKTVQSGRLAGWLSSLGFDVTATREPGGTPLGEQLRRLLLDPQLPTLNHSAELCLFLAARAQLVQEVIRPSLAAGGIVISDRYSASTLVYQGYGLGVDLPLVRAMNESATGGLEPSLTLILDIAPEEGLARRRGDGSAPDRIEARAWEFHRRVRQGYLKLAGEEGERFRVIDASPPEEEVWAAVKKEVSSFISLREPELAAELHLQARPDAS